MKPTIEHHPAPAAKKVRSICDQIGAVTGRQTTWRTEQEQVTRLNQLLVGWANYFRPGTVQRAYRVVDNHVRYRFRQWLKAKYKVRGPGKTRFPKGYLYEELGLYSLQAWPGSSSCAKG